ncbi:hypothetical protein Q6272_33350, partial [Klebsiella pneumoniae]|uniref:hypothetical protein n=1 Tax=Klebsiella pneumoniae TaxID=573 RepID=UPI00276777C2|nr:hypothetical protein [Klebsiella pneumoniae]
VPVDRVDTLVGKKAHGQGLVLDADNIPRSYKLDSQLSYVDVPLCPLDLAAVQVGEPVAKVPDLMGLEALLVESGLA